MIAVHGKILFLDHCDIGVDIWHKGEHKKVGNGSWISKLHSQRRGKLHKEGVRNVKHLKKYELNIEIKGTNLSRKSCL